MNLLLIVYSTALALELKLYRDLNYDFYRTKLNFDGQIIPMVVDLNMQYSTMVCHESNTSQQYEKNVTIAQNPFTLPQLSITERQLIGSILANFNFNVSHTQNITNQIWMSASSRSFIDKSEHYLQLSFDRFEDKNIIFGCQPNMSNSEVKNVLGLGAITGRVFNSFSFPPDIFQLNDNHKEFQLCLGRRQGYLRTPIKDNTSKIELEMHTSKGKYQVQLNSIKLKDTEIVIPNDIITYLDTISPYILLPEAIMKQMQQLYSEVKNLFLDYCSHCTFSLVKEEYICLDAVSQLSDPFSDFPIISLNISNEWISIKAIDYMIEEFGTTICLGFRHTRGNSIILGQPFLMHNLLTFTEDKLFLQKNECGLIIQEEEEMFSSWYNYLWLACVVVLLCAGLIYRCKRRPGLQKISQMELPKKFTDEEELM